MNRAQPKQYLAATQRAVANAATIEWDELPSLADTLARRLKPCGSGPASVLRTEARANDAGFADSIGFERAWDDTCASAVDPTAGSPPRFEETLTGLCTRECTEPEVFRHFVGSGAVGR